MTTTIVARVVRVVMGHSPAALIHAREESGNEHKLEVAVEAARNMSAGQVLVLQWSVHNLPELATPHAVVGEIVDATYTARPTRAVDLCRRSLTSNGRHAWSKRGDAT
jgi:hypothetical protein